MTCKLYSFLLVSCFILEGCYSFKGISIPPTISTFFVDQFQNGAGNAPPDIGQRFSDVLKERVLNNSRLNFDDGVPDIEFTGIISSYSVLSVAPERRTNDAEIERIGEFGSSLNRLSISIQVDYVDNLDDEASWNQVFSFFEDFESSQNLSDVEDELIDNILEQITTDIFNKSFTNW